MLRFYDEHGREMPPTPLLVPGAADTVRVAYRGPVPLNPASLGDDDLELTLAGGKRVKAKLVRASDEKPVPYLVGTYAFTLPKGASAQGMKVRVRGNAVRDANGKALLTRELGPWKS